MKNSGVLLLKDRVDKDYFKCLSNQKDEEMKMKMRKMDKEVREDQKFSFGCDMQAAIRYPSRDVRNTLKYMRLKFKGENWLEIKFKSPQEKDGG